MAKVYYPTEEDLRLFIEIIQEKKFLITKYLPKINEGWYSILSDCIEYVNVTSCFHPEMEFNALCARMLYKITKRHELGDGNKRTAVIGVYLFCLVNDVHITDPKQLKLLAKRIATTKGRDNEDLLNARIAEKLLMIMRPANRP